MEIEEKNSVDKFKMYMNKTEFMNYTGLTRKAVDLLVDTKGFPCTKMNTIYAIKTEDAIRFIDKNKMIIAQ